MKRKFSGYVASTLCVLTMLSEAIAGRGFSHEDSSVVASQSDAVLKWVEQHAVSLRTVELDAGNDSDLRVLGTLINPRTRVIGFGEGPAHGKHEILTLRNRIFAYLVEHHGVTAYAAETSFTDSIRVDDYVVSGGELSREVVDSVYIHRPGRSQGSVENRQLIEWMRAYNERPTTRSPLRFYGIDSCTGHNREGQSPCMRTAIEAVLGYMREVEPASAAVFEKRLAPYWPVYVNPVPIGLDPPPETAPKQALSPRERDAMTAAVADIISLFSERHLSWVNKSSQISYHRAYRSAVVLRQLDAQVRMNTEKPSPDDINTLGSGDRAFKSGRDSAMAENLLWTLEREADRGRVFLFAHDMHLDKAAWSLAGAHLAEILGSQFVLIGSTSTYQPDQSRYPSFDALLSTIDKPLFFLDLRQMPLLRTTQKERGTYWGNLHIAPQWRVQSSYDAMIFIRSLTPSVPDRH